MKSDGEGFFSVMEKQKGMCECVWKRELARGKGVIGDAIGSEWIQAGTEDTKVLEEENGTHDNHNRLRIEWIGRRGNEEAWLDRNQMNPCFIRTEGGLRRWRML